MIIGPFGIGRHLITCQVEGRRATIKSSGVLDTSSLPDFNTAMNRSFDAGARVYNLDLSGITCLATEAIGAIARFIHRVNANAGTVQIFCEGNEKILTIIDRNMLGNLAEINPSVRVSAMRQERELIPA